MHYENNFSPSSDQCNDLKKIKKHRPVRCFKLFFLFVGKEDYSRATVLLLLHSLPLQGLFVFLADRQVHFWVACQILGNFQFIFGEKKFIIAASVPDQDPEPDPFVFGPRGSGSLIICTDPRIRIRIKISRGILISHERPLIMQLSVMIRYLKDYQ